MPDKLCRTCGGDLIKWSACLECRKTIQKICKSCNVKTIEEHHSHHRHLILQQTVNSLSTITTIQSHNRHTNQKTLKKNHYKKNYRNKILVACIISGIIIFGMTSASNPELFSNPKASQIQLISPSDHPQIQSDIQHVETQHTNTDVKYTYSNCLGVSDGIHLTVTCPTGYGNAYKAVVNIPAELMSQFENKVFNMRNLSIIEHLDSISIQYAKKMYDAKFVNS